MKGSKRWVAIIALVAIGALVAGWVVAVHSRPDAGALLDLLPPDADSYALIDLEALQSNPLVKKLLADPHDFAPTAEYQQLLRESGFRYQDDLKQMAAAKVGEDWAGAALVKVDRERFVQYLESQGAIKSQQGASTVYSFGSVRPFRLAFLDEQRMAFAIGADPALLAGVLERNAHRAADSGAEDLRRGGDLDRFLHSNGIAVFSRIDRLLDANPAGVRVGPFQFGKEWLEGSKTMLAFVASSPVKLEVHLDDRCDSNASATRITTALKTILAILRAMPSEQQKTAGTDYTPFMETLQINQAQASVLLDWHLSPGMLMKLLEGAK